MKIGNDSQQVARRVGGRKPKHESRARELRQRLIAWKQAPESLRPSLRGLARELGTSHQLLNHYLDGLQGWRVREEARRIRARAKAEDRKLTRPELIRVLLDPVMVDELEKIRRDARRGPLTWHQVQTLKIFARQGYPEAQELLKTHSRSSVRRKSFAEVVRGTPRQEGENAVDWVRRIWDQCHKYSAESPAVITVELLEDLSRPRGKREDSDR
jgi:hypothetical protein